MRTHRSLPFGKNAEERIEQAMNYILEADALFRLSERQGHETNVALGGVNRLALATEKSAHHRLAVANSISNAVFAELKRRGAK